MNPDEMFLDPTGSNLNESNLNQEAYWEQERQRLLQEQAEGTIDPNLIDVNTGLINTESAGLNEYLREKESEATENTADLVTVHEQQQEEKAYYDTDKRGKPVDTHPHAKALKSHIPFDPKEINPDHPNHEAIYGDTANWSWGQALLGRWFTGPADDKGDLYRNRKHMFESGTGTAGLDTNIIEAENALKGAAFDIVDGLIKLPESIHAASNRQNPFSGSYEFKFDPLKSIGITDPWVGTGIGQFSRAVGSFAIPQAGISRVGGVGTLLTKLSKVGALSKIPNASGPLSRIGPRVNSLHPGQQLMIEEALLLSVSKYRYDETATNILADAPFIKDVPVFSDALEMLAVGENDHPHVKQLKNTLEAISLIGLFGKAAAIIGDTRVAGRGALDPRAQLPFTQKGKELKAIRELKIQDLETSDVARAFGDVAEQSTEMGRSQLIKEANTLRDPSNPNTRTRFRADKNLPTAGPGQGAYLSRNSMRKVFRQLNKIDDIGGIGSTDSVISARQSELIVSDPSYIPKIIREKATELLGEPYVQGLLKDAQASGQTFADVFEPAFRRAKAVLGGDADRMTTEDFWRPILNDLKDSPEALEDIVTTDIINQSLFKALRDEARAGLELNKITDVFGTDNVMKRIAEKLVFGLTSVKRARFLVSPDFRALRGKQATAALEARTALLHDESVDGVRLMMQFMRDADTDELAQGILEVFSMSDKIKNFRDFDNWMRQKLRGGDFADKAKQGVLAKELGTVMINSILSSPKTPLRAIMGTTANAYLNEVATLFGATIRRPFGGEISAFRSAAASTHAMFELIPDAMRVFKANLDANFTGDIATIRSRYSEYTTNDSNFELLGRWAERHGTNGDKAAFYIADAARKANNNKLLTWSSRALGATDDTFRWLLSKARARKKAIEKVMAEGGDDIQITREMLAKAEDIEFERLHDVNGNLDITKDAFLERNFKEVTLTTELQGFTKGLDQLMNRYPLTKPFFLFARTGINGLRMSVKNLPLVGAIVDESRHILSSTNEMLEAGHLLKYGIETASDLRAAKDLILGRQAIGTMVTYGLVQKYMGGQLTGNGPADASKRKMWIDSGWQPRSIKMGNTWVSYDSFEPFNLVMANIADIGDNLELMGPEFAEQRFQLVVAALGKSVTSKTYLQGVNQLFDVLSGKTGYTLNRTVANLANNQLPLAGMRNEMGKVLNPYMRELSSNFWDHVSNRNPILKGGLPVKYDMLNGRPIQDYNFFTRAFNAVSPVQLNLDKGPGRQLLFNSGYDLRLFAYSAPDGTSLVKHPRIRSLYQQAIGKYNLEAELNELAANPRVIASMAAMAEAQRTGNFTLNPMQAFYHNKLLKAIFSRTAKRAWADLRNDPEVQGLLAEKRLLKRSNRTSLERTTRQLLNTPK